jgi:hypothetical protein
LAAEGNGLHARIISIFWHFAIASRLLHTFPQKLLKKESIKAKNLSPTAREKDCTKTGHF